MKPTKLNFHKTVLPFLDHMESECEQLEYDNRVDFIACQTDIAKHAEIFDCRPLPCEFVDESGDAAFHEAAEIKSHLRLPSPSCYFEYSDGVGILAGECECLEPTDLADDVAVAESLAHGHSTTYVSFYPYLRTDVAVDFVKQNFDTGSVCFGEFPNGSNWFDEEPLTFFHITNQAEDDSRAEFIEVCARRLVGTISLLNDKLVACERKNDPAPQLTRARIKRGRTPTSSDFYLLTVNVAAVRRAAQPSVGTHGSPLLHWRRGHWRVAHRFSEFESRHWVRRHLVGDPSRGFARKGYRLTREMPMFEDALS